MTSGIQNGVYRFFKFDIKNGFRSKDRRGSWAARPLTKGNTKSVIFMAGKEKKAARACKPRKEFLPTSKSGLVGRTMFRLLS